MSHSPSERPLYVLPLRVIALAFIGVLILGFIGGVLGSWIIMARFLRTASTGERVIERVERVTEAREDTFATVARESAASVATILDATGGESGQAVAVTADGIFTGVGSPPKGSMRLRFSSGDIQPASIVRVYPESQIFFLRSAGTFPVPTLEQDGVPSEGTLLAALAASSGSVGVRVRLTAVERMDLGSAAIEQTPALAFVPRLSESLPASFHGAPLLSADRRVRGLAFVQEGATALLPSSVLTFYLQDALTYRDGLTVQVLSGLRSQARTVTNAEIRAVVTDIIGVEKGSIWETQGIEIGDEIHRINGQPLTGILPLARPLLETARAGKPASLEIRRGTESLTRQILITL